MAQKRNSVFLSLSDKRLEKLKQEKKRLLIEKDEDISHQEIIYRMIDLLPNSASKGERDD